MDDSRASLLPRIDHDQLERVARIVEPRDRVERRIDRTGVQIPAISGRADGGSGTARLVSAFAGERARRGVRAWWRRLGSGW